MITIPCCFLAARSQQTPDLYLGQKPPGLVPERFAPGLVSSEEYTEYCMTFMPDGREIYFSRGKMGLMMTEWSSDGWTMPHLVAFADSIPGGEAHIFDNGRKMLLNRYRGLREGEAKGVWMLSRDSSGWGNPSLVAEMGMRATAATSGIIYTTDISGFQQAGKDPGIIAVYRPGPGGTIRLPDPDGGISSEVEDAHPLIFPDEDMLIFNSPRPGGKGKGDLYLNCRLPGGKWGKTVNIDSLNTIEADWCASLSPDGRYLFFTRNITGRGDIYWVDIRVLDPYKAQSLSPET